MAVAEPLLLLSCEHGGNRVPREYRACFAGKRALLGSHRGWDPGALAVARLLARALAADLFAATTTRLLVDLNRSPHNPAAVPALVVGRLSRERREALLARHHRPHWERIRAAITASERPVLHVAVHSFTPVFRGTRRGFDVGILYDAKRERERSLAEDWQRRLGRAHPDLRVRRNAPYRGSSDGLTTALRREFAADRYRGLELELNQRSLARPRARRALAAALADAIRDSLASARRGSGRDRSS